MKKFQIFMLIIGLLSLTACATKPIMPPLKYDKPIELQLNKPAYLYWEVGNQYAGNIPTVISRDSGLIGVLVASTVDSVDRTRNPSRYTLSYGKAEQAIFMTSLRNILEQNQVFKQVELITDKGQIAAKDIVINIYFKKTRVATPEKSYKITLSVEMDITHGGKSFKRTYLVESDGESSFVDQQSAVSQQLLDKVIQGITEWGQKH